VKTNRFSWLLLAGLLLAAGRPAAGQFTLHFGGTTLTLESSSKKVAKALAAQTGEVRQRFGENRRALRTMPGSGGKPVYLRQEVAHLIALTGEDLDRAIANVQPEGMEPLRAWAAVKIRNAQDQLAPPPGQRAAWSSGFSAPRAVAVVASRGGLSLPWLASLTANAPRQDTVAAETSDRLLDQVENVISRIFFLASHDDLEVKLWVGSTVPHAKFSFWPEGQIKGTTKASLIIRTDGTKTVLRGLYDYKATHAEGPVTELVQFPSTAGAAGAQMESERLDLVNGSSFFCCRFSEVYCHHVADEKECRS
jgi:hypothetical protein